MPGAVPANAAIKATAIHKVLIAVIVRATFAPESASTAETNILKKILPSSLN
jgi:hypothetical protein